MLSPPPTPLAHVHGNRDLAASAARIAQVGVSLTAGFALIASAAHAGLSVSALEQVGVSLSGERASPTAAAADRRKWSTPLAEVMKDRLSLLILADYNCVNLCGPALALAVGTLKRHSRQINTMG